MRSTNHSASLVATRFDGIADSLPAENFQPGLFGDFARLAFPIQTDVILACIGRTSDRAARAWMSGDATPPGFVATACFLEIQRRCRRK